ncbi:hypothetical protein HKD37_14G039981 [Glycine soja]
MEMADRGRGGGRRTFNRDRRRDVKPLIHVVAPTLNTLPTAQDQPNLTFVRESIPTTLVGDASPLASDDSLTPEYPPNPNCEHIADRRLFIHAHKGEFQPAYGCSNIVSGIIRENFDELTASWLKVSIDLHNRWFREFKYSWYLAEKRAIKVVFETKGSHILKNAMNKIKNGQDKATWILANVRTTLYQHWAYCGGSISIATHFEKLESTQDSPNTTIFVNDNEIYLNVVGGPNYKGNMFGLGTLSKRFSCSKLAPSTSITLVEDEIEEMCETITKLNVELLAKAYKERTLEEKMLQLMENHDQQS